MGVPMWHWCPGPCELCRGPGKETGGAHLQALQDRMQRGHETVILAQPSGGNWRDNPEPCHGLPRSGAGRAAPALGLVLQLRHGLLQVLHDEVHFGPGGAAAHAEAERVPGHVEGDAAVQQHWGRLVPMVRVARGPHTGQQHSALRKHLVALKPGSPDGEVAGIGKPLGPWKLAIQMDSLLTEFSFQPLLQVVADIPHVGLVSLAVLGHQLRGPGLKFRSCPPPNSIG